MNINLPQLQIPTPAVGDYLEYFHRYIQLVPAGEAGRLMVSQLQETQTLYGNVSEEKSLEIPPPYGWTLRKVMGHLCDVERVFGYRAARLAAGDTTALPSFDQTVMVDGMPYSSIPLAKLLEEWRLLRHGNIHLFERCSPAMYQNAASVSDHRMTLAAAANIIVGHMEYHAVIVRKRLGLN